LSQNRLQVEKAGREVYYQGDESPDNTENYDVIDRLIPIFCDHSVPVSLHLRVLIVFVRGIHV
jgi:hypothetical protein